MRTDLPTLERIDGLFAPGTPIEELLGALEDENWQAVQAACQAVGERGELGAVGALLDVLKQQDKLDIYGATDMWSLEDAPDAATREVWRCRFRVKQAACHALGHIGGEHGPEALGTEAIEHLCRYATDDDEDYVVRAAACQALGRIGAEKARTALEAAAGDGEWCTRTEARKALAAM